MHIQNKPRNKREVENYGSKDFETITSDAKPKIKAAIIKYTLKKSQNHIRRLTWLCLLSVIHYLFCVFTAFPESCLDILKAKNIAFIDQLLTPEIMRKVSVASEHCVKLANKAHV